MSGERAARNWLLSAAPARRPEGHHYLFTIVATDLDPKDLPAGLTYAELQEKLKGHRKAASSIVGTYVNPYP